MNVRKLLRSKRAGINVQTAVIAVVSLFMIAILGPVAISTIANADTTNWTAATITVFQTLLPVLFGVGVALYFIPKMASD